MIWGTLLCIIFLDYEKPINLLYGISHLWFLIMLFEIFIIVSLTKNFLDKINRKGCICVLILLLIVDGIVAKIDILPHNHDGRTLFAMQSTFDYLPFFYLGIITEKFEIYNYLKLKKNIGIILCGILFALGTLPFLINLKFTRLYQWIPAYILIIISYSILRQTNLYRVAGGRKKAILSLNKYSLAIYLIHHIYIFIYLDYIPNGQALMNEHYILCPIFMFIIVFLLSILTAYIFSYIPCSKYIIGVSRQKR